jgi:hypothetical protein
MASSKAIRLKLLVVRKKTAHHPTVTDKFFLETVGQLWFPTKSGSDQFLYVSFLLTSF